METKKSRHSIYIFIALTLILASLAILKYASLHSTVFDLGVFLWIFYNISANGQWQLCFYGHVQPFLIPLSYLLTPVPIIFFPYIILFLQSAFLSLPSIGLVRRYGYAALAVFALYFPLWYNNLNDFHMDHLAIPLLFGFYFFTENKKIWLAVVCASLLAFVKEPFALQTIACGIYLLIVSRKILASAFLILFGIIYFYIALHYLIPYVALGEKGFLDLSAFSWMGHSIGDMLFFIIKHPLVITSEIFSNSAKIKYLIAIFGALCFIPLLRPVMLIPAIPVVGIALLSRHESHSSFGTHYTAGLMVPLVMAFIKGLPVAGSLWEKIRLPRKMFAPLIITGLIIGHVIFAPSFLYRYFYVPKIWERHFTAYIPSMRDAAIKEAILSHIPANHGITISTQNNINWSYLVYRHQIMVFPQGIMSAVNYVNPSGYSLLNLLHSIVYRQFPHSLAEKQLADYVVVDVKRPYFIIDEGCQWFYGKCTDNKIEDIFLDLVRMTRERYDMIYEMDGFMIFKRKI
ncbi:MAG: DUF2079 domain-containing protein [Nitrospirae bacterium]|nr:DUF2079 domain-containing protein [Nitrospirota bacterium]